MGEKRSNHTVYNVNYHFVWCPKSSKSKICVPRGISDPAQYRHSILESIEDSLDASFRDVCDEYGHEILSLHISPDHVHLFLSAHPKWFERCSLSSSRESEMSARPRGTRLAFSVERFSCFVPVHPNWIVLHALCHTNSYRCELPEDSTTIWWAFIPPLRLRSRERTNSESFADVGRKNQSVPLSCVGCPSGSQSSSAATGVDCTCS
jgi:REP element-mobilizing transposase RayT